MTTAFGAGQAVGDAEVLVEAVGRGFRSVVHSVVEQSAVGVGQCVHGVAVHGHHVLGGGGRVAPFSGIVGRFGTGQAQPVGFTLDNGVSAMSTVDFRCCRRRPTASG